MTTRKKSAVVESPLVPVSGPTPVDEGFAKFTWSIRGKKESLTIRSDDEAELQALREKWTGIIVPKNKELPKLLPGDKCTDEKCDGHFVVKTTNGKPGQKPYAFLSCSNFPRCRHTAYIKSENGGNGHDAGKAKTALATA